MYSLRSTNIYVLELRNRIFEIYADMLRPWRAKAVQQPTVLNLNE